jgi:hypothetical protein
MNDLLYREQLIHLRIQTLKDRGYPDHVVLVRLTDEFVDSMSPSELRQTIIRHLKSLNHHAT